MKIHESAENYLKTILILQQRIGAVRAIDIAHEMGFSKPSVSVYVHNLRDSGYIEIDKSGYITLTDSGRQIAEMIYDRHHTLAQMLINMGIDPDTAMDEACRMEHIIDPETFEAFKTFSECRADCPHRLAHEGGDPEPEEEKRALSGEEPA